MKTIIYFFILTSSAFLINCRTSSNESINTLPHFELQLLDSLTILPSENIPADKSAIFILINTNCPHCRAATKLILEKADSLSNVSIFFLTEMPLADLKQYNDTYRLSDHKNIVLGRDFHHVFFGLYKPKVVPYIAIYDRQRKLLKVYKEEAPIKEILALMRG